MVAVNKDSITIEPTHDNIEMFTKHVMDKNNIRIPYTYAGVGYIGKNMFPVYIFFDDKEMRFVKNLTKDMLLNKSNFERFDLDDNFLRELGGTDGNTN